MPSTSYGTRRLPRHRTSVDRVGVEDLGHLHRLAVAGEVHRHRPGEALVLVVAGVQPADVVRPDNDDAATWPADPFHLGQAASPPCPAAGVRTEHATTRSAHPLPTGRSSKNPCVTRARYPWSALASFRSRIARRPAAGSMATTSRPRSMSSSVRRPSRPDLHDPVRAARQPAHHPGMEPLRAGHPLVKLRLEAIQQFPGQGLVGLRIAVRVRRKAPGLVAGQYPEVRGCVAAAQLPAQAGRVLRSDHRPRPSSCRSPTRGLTAAPRPEGRAEAFPRRSPRGSRRSGSAPRATERRY